MLVIMPLGDALAHGSSPIDIAAIYALTSSVAFS
jgi:hypothetical protein